MQTESYGWEAGAPGSSDYINPAIMSIAARLNPRRVLDAGCGNGALCAALVEAAYEVTGVDADAGGLEIARSRAPTVQFGRSLFSEPPLATDFDMVVSTEVVEHLYAPHELASYAFAALRPGGALAISTPYHGYLKNLALSLTNKWDHHHTALWHGGHIKFWSRATLEALLRQAGFEMTGFVGVGRLPGLWKSMILIGRKPA